MLVSWIHVETARSHFFDAGLGIPKRRLRSELTLLCTQPRNTFWRQAPIQGSATLFCHVLRNLVLFGSVRILRIYLTHFRGQRSAMMQWMAPAGGTEAEAWDTLTAALGLKGVSAGQRWTAPAGVPALSGVVEHVSQNPHNALLRLDMPGPGAAALGAVNCGGPIMVTLSFYLYGDQAAGTVARESGFKNASRCRRRRARVNERNDGSALPSLRSFSGSLPCTWGGSG